LLSAVGFLAVSLWPLAQFLSNKKVWGSIVTLSPCRFSASCHYLVVMTTYWCYFSCITLWPFMVLQPNLIPRCALTVHRLAVYQISGQLDNTFLFYDNFCCLTKRRKQKRKKNEETQWSFISQKHLAQFSWHSECEVMTLAGISTAKISWFRWSVMELRIHENHIIVLPVNNSWVWCAGFLGRMCLDI